MRSASTRSARSASTPWRRRTPVIRGCRWAPRRWRTSCGRATCATIRRHPRVEQSRSLRAFRRARKRAVVQPSVSHGLRRSRSMTSSTFGSGAARRPGHPERGRHAGRRGHHRAARSGIRQRGRDGDGGAVARGDVQSARPRDRRSPHVRHRERRRSDGGRGRRGGVARRRSAVSAG